MVSLATPKSAAPQVPYDQLYEVMVRIRLFEERLKDEYATGRLPGFVHLYCGEEAVAAGFAPHLAVDDYITSTHRGHGHCIAKGVSMRGMVAELLARSTGLCKGKGGSMHIADFDRGMIGANGIVGGGLGIACGAGLSAKTRGAKQVVVTFFGDGATNQGIFHEAMNLAAIWRLPVVFACENNHYGQGTPHSYASAVERIADRATSYNMPGVTVDGMDVLAVYEAAGEAIKRARDGQGPSLLELKTNRFYGHFQGDAQRYRPAGEDQLIRALDPIETYRRLALKNGWLTEEDITCMNARALADIDEAWVFGYESPMPDPSEALTEVYANA
jgi:acetoin:2,6-dichlorophenolindophenol oxidoreductase subunit alpha